MHVVSIGGSDSSSGAGVQADVRTCSALGVYCMCVVTAVTAQNASSITRIKPIDADTVRAQISAVLDSREEVTVKIGMLYSRGVIDAVADALNSVGNRMSVVVDPVLRAGSGRYLIRSDARSHYVERIIPLATVVTPNVMEAEWLSSMKIECYEDACRAAERIASLAGSVVVKGGHMQHGEDVTDILYHDGRFHRFTNRRIRSMRLHGAGTIFSAAVAAELAKGMDLVSAVRIANRFTYMAILNASSTDGSTLIPLVGNECIGDGDEVTVMLRRAVDMLQFNEDLAMLIPESQSNFVFARPNASSIAHVAGVAGRIVKHEHSSDGVYAGYRYARAAGPVRYGSSKHVAGAVLTAMRYDPRIRSAMNIRYDDAILEICRDLGMIVSGYDRSKEPEHVKRSEGMSVIWGTEQAILAASKVPDVIYHRGDWGKEPMIVLFGHDPLDVLRKVTSILERYKRDHDGL